MEKTTWVKVGSVMISKAGKQYVALNVTGNKNKDGDGAIKLSVKVDGNWQEVKADENGKLFLSIKANDEGKSPEFVKADLITALRN